VIFPVLLPSWVHESGPVNFDQGLSPAYAPGFGLAGRNKNLKVTRVWLPVGVASFG
jgi:hypothetical protein